MSLQGILPYYECPHTCLIAITSMYIQAQFIYIYLHFAQKEVYTNTWQCPLVFYHCVSRISVFFSIDEIKIFIIHTYIHTYLLLLILMLWHRQAIFESKGDKLSSPAESRIRTRDPRHLFASRLNARWQTDWAIEDQAKNLNSTARPYDQRAFSPLGPTVSWLSHLALAIYIFVVVNFDALAQASDFRIERRQVVFLCWEQDSNPGPQTPIRQQTECSLTNRLSYRGSS